MRAGGTNSFFRVSKIAESMVRIAISQAAFDAIAATLALGSVGYENATDDQGRRLIWLLRQRWWLGSEALRGPGESYSDVILRLAANAVSP